MEVPTSIAAVGVGTIGQLSNKSKLIQELMNLHMDVDRRKLLNSKAFFLMYLGVIAEFCQDTFVLSKSTIMPFERGNDHTGTST
jgi:hypothetical protein